VTVARDPRAPIAVVPVEEIWDRFWSKVRFSEACWLWQAAIRLSDGIGVFGFEGKILYAHRAAFALTRGVIPEGMDVRRTCLNPLCVRPSHLALFLRPVPGAASPLH
jgi:hypothetical protein